MTAVPTFWQAVANQQISQLAYLPCNQLNALMREAPADLPVWPITRESAGIGLCFGRSLAGQRSAMLIQSTGLGNLLTELYTLPHLYREALPIFVSWRGVHNEPIEAQIVLGQRIEALLAAMEIEQFSYHQPGDLDALSENLGRGFAAGRVQCHLLSPALWADASQHVPDQGEPRPAPLDFHCEGYTGTPVEARQAALARASEVFGEEDLAIAQIGFPAKELYNTADRPQNFYMLGALGAATEVGIGLAGAQHRHVFVLDGDGSFCFSPNQLLHLGMFGPSNLSVVCLDNGSWGSTGHQPAPSSRGMNASALARAAGTTDIVMASNPEHFSEALAAKHRFIHYPILPGNAPGDDIPLTALKIKQRFMAAIGA